MSRPKTDPAPPGPKIEILKVVNRLKRKLGIQGQHSEPGYLDPEAVAQADEIIRKLCAECPATVTAHLKELSALWAKMRDMPQSPERETVSGKIFTLSHEIKDVSAMCGYGLTAYFSESLRDYIDQTELNLEAQRVIIQAHIDALQVVHTKGLKDEAGPECDTLKKMVKVAIDKYR